MVEQRAKFTQMKDGDAEDYSIIAASNAKDYDYLADKVLNHLLELKDDYGGFQVDRLTHSLQTATRAYRDGQNNEDVVCALIHDIGDNLAPANHAEFAATILEPFVSEENYWSVKHHGIFQGYYFFEFLGLDKNMREQFIDNPYYESCKEFCEKYDQNSFDPDYESLDLEFFVPMVKELFRKPKKSIYLCVSSIVIILFLIVVILCCVLSPGPAFFVCLFRRVLFMCFCLQGSQ